MRVVLCQQAVDELKKLTPTEIRLLCDEGWPVGEVYSKTSVRNWFNSRIASPLDLDFERDHNGLTSVTNPLTPYSRRKLKSFWMNPDQEINVSDYPLPVDPAFLDEGKEVVSIENYQLPKHIAERYYRFPKLNARVRLLRNRLGDEKMEWLSYDPVTSWVYREELDDEELYQLLRDTELKTKKIRQ